MCEGLRGSDIQSCNFFLAYSTLEIKVYCQRPKTSPEGRRSGGFTCGLKGRTVMEIPCSQNMAPWVCWHMPLLECLWYYWLLGPTISPVCQEVVSKRSAGCHERSVEQKCSSDLVFSLEDESCHPLLGLPLHWGKLDAWRTKPSSYVLLQGEEWETKRNSRWPWSWRMLSWLERSCFF